MFLKDASDSCFRLDGPISHEIAMFLTLELELIREPFPARDVKRSSERLVLL